MEEKRLHPVVSMILPLFDTCEEMIGMIKEQELDQVHENLMILAEAFRSMECTIIALLPLIQYPNKLKEITMNMPILAQRLVAAANSGQYEEVAWRFRCELRPMFIFWQRYFNFFMVQCIDDESMAEYNRAEAEAIRLLAAEPKQDKEREYRYDLSIVVLFYNHEEMTAQCIDALEKYTVGYSYEIITMNNGSDDAATKWSETLKHQKKIHFPINIGSSGGGNVAINLAGEFIDGKYLVFVSNDVIVTENYIKSLFECMESDPRIIMATPVTNRLSNQQTIPVPYGEGDLPAMHQFAAEYNTFEPKKWRERARLFPFIALYRPAETIKFEFEENPFFCYDMFADDDFCLRYRRAGYQQVLCTDVFVHHFGSITLGAEQDEVMNLGRRQFFDKFGVDSWATLEMSSKSFTSILGEVTVPQVRILYFEPRFGEGALAIKSQLKENGCQSILMDALTADARYLEDMKMLFRHSAMTDQWDKTEIFKNQYDFIFCEGNLEDSGFLPQYLKIAAHCLAEQGRFCFVIKNAYGYNSVSPLLNSIEVCPAWEKEALIHPCVSFISINMLIKTLKNAGLTVSYLLANKTLTDEAVVQAKKLLSAFDEKSRATLSENLAIDHYFVICKKEL